RALDAAGNPVPAALGLEAEGAELDGVRDLAPGEVEARVRAGPSFGGRTQVRVTATAEGTGISGARVLPLRPGQPAVARFEGAAAVMRGDGTEPALLRVAVADRHGNPVDAQPEVSADRGKVLGIARAAPGAFDVRYVAPAVSLATRERLLATVGAARATAEPLLAGPSPGMRATPGAGFLFDLKGRFAEPRAGVAVEMPADWAPLLERRLEPAWRTELEATGLPSGAAVALLGGASVETPLLVAPTALRASATAGVLMGSSGGAFAGRAALGATFPAGPLELFAETSVLAARGGGPGSFAAAGIGVGVRLTMERPHGDDPHRR
ncbi:MAG TPA: hypothetical protein VFK90_17305, partial [Anaeromyxobacter sp.]|nr:hypothetical protein [Anaeromyxobacter sp.]